MRNHAVLDTGSLCAATRGVVARFLALPAAAVIIALIAAAPAAAQGPGLESINYAFSTQLGGGIYTVEGRTIQIYRISLARRLRDPGERTWGVKVIVRTTLGFYNLRLDDIIDKGIPDNIGTLAVVPEIEFEAPPWKENWQILPFFAAGGGKDFEGGSFNYILALGIRSRVIWPWKENYRIRLGNQLIYSVATNRDADFSDDFGLFDTVVDLRRPLGFGPWNHEIDASVYGANYLFLISPRLIDLDDADLHFTMNWELGVTLGTAEPWRILGLQLPRIGIGYRFDSKRGAIRLLIGETVPIIPPGQRSATVQ